MKLCRILKKAGRALSEALCIPYCVTVALTVYASYAAWWYGTPLPRWWAAGMYITLCVPAAMLAGAAVYAWLRPRRLGLIGRDELLRILTVPKN